MELLPHGLKQHTDWGICSTERVRAFRIKSHTFSDRKPYHWRQKIPHFILKHLLIGPSCLNTSDFPQSFLVHKIFRVFLNTFKTTVVLFPLYSSSPTQ